MGPESAVRVPRRSEVRVAPAGTANAKTSSGRGLGQEAEPLPPTLSLCPKRHGSGPARLGRTWSNKRPKDAGGWGQGSPHPLQRPLDTPSRGRS